MYRNNIAEIVAFTKKLVAARSQNEIESETNVAKLVYNKLVGFGFSPKIIGPKNHPSVICNVRKKDSVKTVWLESCLDTVPAGDSKKWDYPPFSGKIIGNKMYGRGVADSKVAIAAFCYLAKELYQDTRFKGSLFLGFDADEQTGNFTGVKEIFKHAPKADACILGYQGIGEISIGARGNLVLKLIVFGQSAHTGSRTKKGVNAIHLMGKTISVLTGLGLEEKKEPFFEFGSSLNISKIKGGLVFNMVPDKCEAIIDIRTIASQKQKEVFNKIKNVLEAIKIKDRTFKYSLEVLQAYDSYLTDPQNKFVQIFQKTAKEILSKNIPLKASGQKSVGNLISRFKVPIINAFGVESDNVHAPNEWINIKTLPAVYRIYKQAIIKFCGT
ncbi:MAG: M20 family metallopeptidase [bacterium]|nr:M20 family metallopeptidase [bacterium]